MRGPQAAGQRAAPRTDERWGVQGREDEEAKRVQLR